MVSRFADSTTPVKVVVAHDTLQDYTFAHLIADGLQGRSNIEI